MVDLSRDGKGRTRARLLDLVPGRSGAVYAQWLKARNDAFRAQIQVATLDPFHGYKNALDDELEDAVAVRVRRLGGVRVDAVSHGRPLAPTLPAEDCRVCGCG